MTSSARGPASSPVDPWTRPPRPTWPPRAGLVHNARPCQTGLSRAALAPPRRARPPEPLREPGGAPVAVAGGDRRTHRPEQPARAASPAGVLRVDVASPAWRATLEAEEPALRARLNAALRSTSIERLEFEVRAARPVTAVLLLVLAARGPAPASVPEVEAQVAQSLRQAFERIGRVAPQTRSGALDGGPLPGGGCARLERPGGGLGGTGPGGRRHVACRRVGCPAPGVDHPRLAARRGAARLPAADGPRHRPGLPRWTGSGGHPGPGGHRPRARRTEGGAAAVSPQAEAARHRTSCAGSFFPPLGTPEVFVTLPTRPGGQGAFASGASRAGSARRSPSPPPAATRSRCWATGPPGRRWPPSSRSRWATWHRHAGSRAALAPGGPRSHPQPTTLSEGRAAILWPHQRPAGRATGHRG